LDATLPNRWALAAGRSPAKGCVICRGPRLPGARLCGPCKAALKRARLETVAELVPRPSRAVAEAQEMRRRAKERAAARPATPKRRRLLIPASLLVMALMAGAGYLTWHVARSGHEGPAAPVAPSRSPIAHPPAAQIARSAPAAAPVAIEAKRIVDVLPPQPATRAPMAPHPPRVAPKRAPEAAAAPVTLPADRFAAAAQPALPAAVPMTEAVLPAREAPVPDRWQVMADQIVRCGRDGFLAGVICEQRVRLKYCEGYWGQAPQCASGVPNEHGN
jgi:hypothetical protein